MEAEILMATRFSARPAAPPPAPTALPVNDRAGVEHFPCPDCGSDLFLYFDPSEPAAPPDAVCLDCVGWVPVDCGDLDPDADYGDGA